MVIGYKGAGKARFNIVLTLPLEKFRCFGLKYAFIAANTKQITPLPNF